MGKNWKLVQDKENNAIMFYLVLEAYRSDSPILCYIPAVLLTGIKYIVFTRIFGLDMFISTNNVMFRMGEAFFLPAFHTQNCLNIVSSRQLGSIFA